MKRPEILTYESEAYADGLNPPPDHMTYAAAMVSDGRPGTSWMATGSTAEEARAKLIAIWERQFPTTKRGQHLRKTSNAGQKDVYELDVVL